ncbi:unnamed protein product [Mycena citricolor]|uniref:Uncharacterized protein n=1 Tax=Mycena citricolor TaxID=2018698 RepID=A0AAD2GZH3_9AGAR|nr:unnamed protein product [Mycena citricolor]
MYAPPRLREMTIRGPRYRLRIFALSDFSIAVFRIKTRSPRLKSKSRIVTEWSNSNWAASWSRASYTREWSAARSSRRFWRAIARRVMSSVVESTDSGGGSRYVASDMSSGRRGCVPVTAK